jgi:hypothetical protein
MLIKLMKLFEYDATGRNCQEFRTADPTWEEIERVVRRLEKFRFPFAWFFLSADAFEDDLPDFEIMGGPDDYFMVCSADGCQRRYHDPSQGKLLVHVWTSDQGAAIPAEFVCHDVELVLKAIRYFSSSGKCCPEISWK